MFQKKRVTFADCTGRSLESVIEIIPCKLGDNFLWNTPKEQLAPKSCARDGYLTCLFEQPVERNDFYQRLKERHVSLESVVCDRTVIRGSARVINVAFRKEVTVRCTLDGWESFRDIWADYVSTSRNGTTDQFFFRIPLPSMLQNGARVEFAVRYSVNGRDFWDNNFKQNYCVLL